MTRLILCLSILVSLSGLGQYAVGDPPIKMEISFQDGNEYFEPSSDSNIVYVLLRNVSDSTVEFLERWNSWGYDTFTFEIETEDSTYSLVRPRKLWWRNFPSSFVIESKDTLLMTFNLIDTNHASNYKAQQWLGFPEKIVETAKIRVKYNPPDAHKLASHIKMVENRRNYRNVDYRDDAESYFDTTILYQTQPEAINKSNVYKTHILIEPIQSAFVPIRLK